MKTHCVFFRVVLCASMILKTCSSQESSNAGNIPESSYFIYQQSEFPRDCAEVEEQCSGRVSSGVYAIKPDGFHTPFDVFCDQGDDSGGWTLIQRRNSEGTDFDRSWLEFERGFGFVNGEFWLGNQKLAFLTNQKRYQLRIDMVTSNESSFYTTYDKFRISDGWSGYKLLSVGEYNGTAVLSGEELTPTDCYDVYASGLFSDGVYTIQPIAWTGSAFQVYCDMSHGGGWTVFQRRQDGSVDFYRTWDSYKTGFGDPTTEHWLGNEKLHYMTKLKNYTMRIDIVNREGVKYNMNYDSFAVSSEADNYRLDLGTFTGNTSFDYMTRERGTEFSTHDDDNDGYSSNCASNYRGGWWYDNCYNANLNGDYSSSSNTGVTVCDCGHGSAYQYRLQQTEMKIRPV